MLSHKQWINVKQWETQTNTFLWLIVHILRRVPALSRKVSPDKGLMSLALLQHRHHHHGVGFGVSPGGPVQWELWEGACCGLLQLPLPWEIDELIVGLLPVCLCPGRRCPGYGWESQLWHPPWGFYCGRPAGGPGGWWPWEQIWLTYCCHTLGDTAALTPAPTSDWLGREWLSVEGRETTWLCQTSLDDSS